MRLTHCNTLSLLVVLATFSNVVCASGWTDYELPIDPGYTIFRCNSLDVCLGNTTGSLIYVPGNYAQTGPIDAYYVSSKHIFLRTLGRLPRNAFKGDTLEDVDYSKQFFFVFNKASDSLVGPLSDAEFHSHSAVHDCNAIYWSTPRNPNADLPLFVGVTFIAFIVAAWLVSLIRSNWTSQTCETEPSTAPDSAT